MSILFSGITLDSSKCTPTVATWLTLEPRETGEQTIQIFLMSSDGTIIEGKTRTIKVTKNMKDYAKKLTSIGSLLGELAVPLAKILPTLIQ